MNTIKRGDNIIIHFSSETLPHGFALCRYTGRRNGRHHFSSDTYDRQYIVDLKTNTVVCSDHPDKIYKIDNSTGWASLLPV